MGAAPTRPSFSPQDQRGTAMTRPIIPRAALPALLGLALAGLAAGTGFGGTDQTAPIQCGVSATTERGMLVIEGVLRAETAIAGNYAFSVKRSGPGGRADIRQAGPFAVPAGQTVTLGRIAIGPGAAPEIAFTLETGGTTYDCGTLIETRV